MKSKLDSYRHSVYLSTIFLKVAHHYYEITVDTTVFSLTVPDLKTALNDYNWLQKALNAYSVHIADDTHSELWNITADYTAHFTGLNMLKQSDLASISEDKSLSLQLIHDSCDIMICHWHNNASSQTDLMWKIFQSISMMLSDKPLRIVLLQTLAQYVKIWQHLMLYLLCISSELAKHCVSFTQEQHDLIADIYKEDNNLVTAALTDTLLILGLSLITQLITHDQF